MSTMFALRRASGGPLLRLLVPGALSCPSPLTILVFRLKTIKWLTKIGKEFFTSPGKPLMSSHFRHPAPSSSILGKEAFHFPPMTQTWCFLSGRQELRAKEVQVTFTRPFFWKTEAVPQLQFGLEEVTFQPIDVRG
jgi:hypothetical protein